MKELSIGEMAVINGIKVKCVEHNEDTNIDTCKVCVFSHYCCDGIRCAAFERSDRKDVRFVKVD